MAISAKPNRKNSGVEGTNAEVDEREVQAVINRGGRAAGGWQWGVGRFTAGSVEALL